MKYLFALIGSVILFSCNGQRDTSINDSSLVDTNSTKLIMDSVLNPLKKKYPDSIQNKVVSNIRFGIKKKDFEHLAKIFEKIHSHNKRIVLGNYTFVLLSPAYYQGKLYEVELYNPFVETESDLKQTIQGAYDLVTAQYGKPDSTHNGHISKDDEDLFVWRIGRKHIKISSGYFYNMYHVNLVFTDTEILGRMQTKEYKLRDSLTRSGKKDI